MDRCKISHIGKKESKERRRIKESFKEQQQQQKRSEYQAHQFRNVRRSQKRKRSNV